jgi:hypothetical protein
MELAAATLPKIPAWNDLCQDIYSEKSDPAFARIVRQLVTKKPTIPYYIGRRIVETFMPGVCYQKFLDFRWQEIVELIADQTQRNKAILGNLDAATQASLVPVTGKFDKRIFRPHSQLPCTQGTAAMRVQKALDLLNHNAKILLLGDDDFVSIELAEAGFRNITAIDIDKKIIGDIKKIADSRGLKVRLAVHDLRKPVPLELMDEYDLVFFDPQYSPEGLELFLSAALNFTSGYPNTLFFSSIHLMSLMPSGIQAVESLLDQAGVELIEFQQGFNVYPVPARLRSLIYLVNQCVIGSRDLGIGGYTFPYFLSDALLLRKI